MIIVSSTARPFDWNNTKKGRKMKKLQLSNLVLKNFLTFRFPLVCCFETHELVFNRISCDFED